MARYIGIDHGTKRIGLAVGDTETGVVTPIDVVDGCDDANKDAAAVSAVVARYAVDGLVVGLPLNMDDTEGDQAKRVRAFASALSTATDLPLHFQDERLSSFAADELLADSELSRAKRRRQRDRLAAAAILEMFLRSSA